MANFFLTNAKMFEISILQDHNPSYAELAEIMEKLGLLVYEIVNDIDPVLASNAMDYSSQMKFMSVAITNGDREELDRLVQDLNRRSFS